MNRNALVCLLVWLVAAPMAARAQDGSTGQNQPAGGIDVRIRSDDPIPESVRRPFRGLFLGNETNEVGPGLNVRLQTDGGYDDDLLADQTGSNRRNRLSGPFVGGEADVYYQRGSDRKLFRVTTESAYRQYTGEEAFGGWSQGANVMANIPLGPRTDLSLMQGIRYSPLYQVASALNVPTDSTGAPVLPQGNGFDGNVVSIPNYSYDTDIHYTHTSGRSTFQALFTNRLITYDSADAVSDGHWLRAGALYSRHTSRYAQLRLGYEQERTRYGLTSADEQIIHRLNVGFAYGRPLSFSRRTTVSGSAGTAEVRHEIGRTWVLRGAYDRGMQFLEFIPRPLLGSQSSFSAMGLVSRRTDLQFQAGYSRGAVNQLATDIQDLFATRYRDYFFSSQVRYAWSPRWALFGRYSYYDSLYQGTIVSERPGALRRNSVQVGLTYWIPVYTPRVSHASR